MGNESLAAPSPSFDESLAAQASDSPEAPRLDFSAGAVPRALARHRLSCSPLVLPVPPSLSSVSLSSTLGRRRPQQLLAQPAHVPPAGQRDGAATSHAGRSRRVYSLASGFWAALGMKK